MLTKNDVKKWLNKIKGSYLGFISLLFLFSWSLHFVSLISLPTIDLTPKHLKKDKNKTVTIKFNPQSNEDLNSAAQDKKIVEVIQEETKNKPLPKTKRLGYTTHFTEKETKAKVTKKKKGMNPGQGGDSKKTVAKKKPAPPPSIQKQIEQALQDSVAATEKRTLSTQGSLSFNDYQQKQLQNKPQFAPEKQTIRNNYENLLSQSIDMMDHEVMEGYQDYIDETLEEGSFIDLNTQEYRYIGYFTNMRKAIELAWVYPIAALKKGLHGNVNLKFTIKPDGKIVKIKVLGSSGHRILDHAIVSAIQLAAPFAPLPKSFGKKLNIKGTFRYVIN